MRTVGLLLVSALMVVPVAAAHNLVRGFNAGLITAMVLGVVTSVGGAVGSFYARHCARALIVVLAIAVFGLSWPISWLLRRRRGAAVLPEALDDEELAAPHAVTEGHPHQHAPGCGHQRCSTATTPTSSTRATGTRPMPTTTTSTEPPAEAAERASR